MAAYKLGRPDWGQDDDEAAEEYAYSVSEATSETADASVLRADWAAVAAYYWAAAYAALVDGDFRRMRDHARVAEEAREYASPEGALLSAIFGGCEKSPASRLVAIGRTLPADQVSTARQAVLAEVARHAAAGKAAERAHEEAERAARRVEEKAATAARAEEVSEKLAVGQVYTASLPYRLAKKTSGLCRVNGILVAAPNVGDGGAVRITALRAGRSYGLMYEAEGEKA